MKPKLAAIAALVTSAATVMSVGAVAAQDGRVGVGAGVVTACSTNGRHECYSANVKQSRYGESIVLRNGTVIDCGSDCRDTLRQATVDFWDSQRDNGS